MEKYFKMQDRAIFFSLLHVYEKMLNMIYYAWNFNVMSELRDQGNESRL